MSRYDFYINGVGYHAAEDAEGDHYSLSGEPLRPPNAVTVQGEQSNKFQMRADTMQWTLTDWSGGEGQIKFSNSQPSAWRELNGVRVFNQPGTLRPGYYVEDTQDSTGVADFVVHGHLVRGIGNLYLLASGATNNDVYLWDGSKWGAAVVVTGPTQGSNPAPTGDAVRVYWIEDGTDNIYAWTGTGAATKIDSNALPDSTDSGLIELGPYVYWHRALSGEVWEIAKIGAYEVLIDDFGDDTGVPVGGALGGLPAMCAMDGRIYVLVVHDNLTTIREVTPTTAAGTGFGSEIARIPGFVGEAIWAHSGMLYIPGRDVADELTVLYLTPGGEYGSLGRLRSGTNLGTIAASAQNGTMLSHFFVAEGPSGVHQVYEIDTVTGGVAVVGINEDGNSTDDLQEAVVFDGDIFYTVRSDAGTVRVMRARTDQYTKSSSAVSAWHDYDLADEKILASLVLSCEALPADWNILIDYAIDGSSSFTNAITYTTDSGKGIKTAVSTDTSTIKFRTLCIRIRMVYTGAGIPTTGPVILGVDALAQVAKPQKVWRLLLDLGDEASRTAQGHSGSRKITNITTAADLEQVVAFRDGYQKRNAYSEYDVLIDAYSVSLSAPGEGVAAVVLREVA